jgi:hypothetical protein
MGGSTVLEQWMQTPGNIPTIVSTMPTDEEILWESVGPIDITGAYWVP